LLLLCAQVGLDYVRVRQVFVPPEQRLLWGGVPAWPRASQTVWFQDTYRFAVYVTTDVRPDNAAWALQEGLALLNYSPEPRVIDRIICSVGLLGQHALARDHGLRRLPPAPGKSPASAGEFTDAAPASGCYTPKPEGE